jgi:hypothetical protein
MEKTSLIVHNINNLHKQFVLNIGEIREGKKGFIHNAGPWRNAVSPLFIRFFLYRPGRREF